MDDAAIHRVSGDAGGQCVSFIEDQWIATGLRPRDDKGGGICDDNNWRKGTVRAYFSLFTLHSSLF